MDYHITKIVNNSPRSVVLTNPAAPRDRHFLAANSSVVPANSPKVNFIADDSVPYAVAVKTALNVYTIKDNWCFWDDGGSDHLMALGEAEGHVKLFTKDNSTKLELVIDGYGIPGLQTSEVILPLKMESQTKDGLRLNWCWAAATVSIANYYIENYHPTKPRWRQCELANKAFSETECCKFLNCDRPWQGNEALRETGNLADAFEAQINFQRVMEQIDEGRPISVALAGSGTGHNVVITGYNIKNPNKPTVRIQDPDPFGGTSILDFAAFCDSYEGWTWKQTYLTHESQ